MKALISLTGVGQAGNETEFTDLTDLVSKTRASDFVRVSYTNSGAHPRCHTWYPVRGLLDASFEFQFETAWQDGYRKRE